MNDFVRRTPARCGETRIARKRNAFTLVELLVVIVIIAILIALLVPAIGAALRAAKNGRIGIEVANLTTAIKQYRNEMGAYPPDFAGNDNHDLQVALKAHLARKFRNRKPNDVLPVSMTPQQLNAMYGVGNLYPDNQPSAIGLDPSEALVFALSGFSPSPTHPVTGAGERKALYEFDKSRLRDADGDGFPEYYAKDAEQPYVYLQTYTNVKTLAELGSFYPAQISTQKALLPYKSESSDSGFAEPDGFQIISAGLDNEFGAAGGVYPGGLGYTSADQDNITNFSEGKTLEDALP